MLREMNSPLQVCVVCKDYLDFYCSDWALVRVRISANKEVQGNME